VGAGYASLFGLKAPGYFIKANDELLKILQIEHIDAVNRIDEILDVKGIDVVFIGPTDLASSMGLLGQASQGELQKAIDTVAAAAKKRSLPLGIFCFSPQEAIAAASKGFTFISLGLDSAFLSAAASEALKALREHIGPAR
jgi:2-keto-3-deoxy-L-rhamnonate aldolase RhmA